MENKDIIVFLDSVGRTLFAEKDEARSDDENLVVKNPVVVHINSLEGQMKLQLLPVFFKEFVADKDQDVVFTYRRSQVTLADPIVFDARLYNNYRQMFSNIILPQPEQNQPGPTKVIDLFDQNAKSNG